MIELICQQCGKEFKVSPYRSNTARFCSQECHYKAEKGTSRQSHLSIKGRLKISDSRRKVYIGKEELEDLYWRNNLSSIQIASRIGTSSGVIKYWLNKYNIPHKTLSQARIGKYQGSNHPNWQPRVKKICPQCGAEFEEPPSLSHIRFCSKKCWYEHGYSEESRRKMSISQLRILEDPQQKQAYLHRILDNCNIKPNKVERALDDILQRHFLGEWKYTDDFSVIIGGKSPDWTNCNGRKDIILLHGIYWHLWKEQRENPSLTKEQVERRDIRHYKQFGYNTLVIWEDELKELPEKKIVAKIKNFQRRKHAHATHP